MKPFNLQEALAGKPVITRDGRKVSHIFYAPSAFPDSRVLAVAEGQRVFGCHEDGKWSPAKTEDSPKDLFMASEKKEGWINLYRSTTDYLAAYVEGGTAVTHVFKIKEDAIKHRIEVLKDKYITTVSISWEE